MIGVRDDTGALAFDRASLQERSQLTREIDGVPYLAVYHADLDAGYVYRNPEGRTFEAATGGFRDEEGTVHAPDSLPLDRAMAFEAKWFAWYGYYPDTGLAP